MCSFTHPLLLSDQFTLIEYLGEPIVMSTGLSLSYSKRNLQPLLPPADLGIRWYPGSPYSTKHLGLPVVQSTPLRPVASVHQSRHRAFPFFLHSSSSAWLIRRSALTNISNVDKLFIILFPIPICQGGSM